MALIQTNPKRRRYGVAALAGVLGGIVSAIVKFGWEVPLPPRTPERNATNPPQELLQQLGVPESVTHLSYSFNGNDGLPWVSFIVHFAFAIGFAVIYCVLAERFPQIKLWQGAAFGILVSSGLTSCSCPPRASSLPPGTSSTTAREGEPTSASSLPPGTSPSPSASRSPSATSSRCG